MPGETCRISDNDLSDFNNDAEIASLRVMRHRTDAGWARAEEAIVAWERHHDGCRAIAKALGCDDAETTYCKAVDASEAIGNAIIAAGATTLSGLAVRARIVIGLTGDDDEPDHLTTDEKMM